MNISKTHLLPLVMLAVICAGPLRADDDSPPSDSNVLPRSRVFRLGYGAKIEQLPEVASVRVWLPVPPSNEHQTVKELKRELPAVGRIETEANFGNKILYFAMPAPASGESVLQLTYRVERDEVRTLDRPAKESNLTAKERRTFLSANRNVPIGGKPLLLLNGMRFRKDSVSVARQLYDRVDEHVRYDKSKPGYGNGDVLWVCDSRFGNCTDFHSLFISLARSRGIPARFEIGFPLPKQRGEGAIGGYHCWASFHTAERGWVPVDISEADKHPDLKDYYFGNLTEDRVTFSTGRDINLVPRQKSQPLNYFVYPHVEVDGKVWPKERIKLSLSYVDE